MAVGYNPRAVTEGLVLALDAGNPKNYNAGISTNWVDKVGGNNGTLVGGTHHNDGPFIGAGYVDFDGSGDYLNASNSEFAFGTGDFTIDLWFNSDTISIATQRGLFQTSDTAGGLKTTYTTGVHIAQSTSGEGSLRANVLGTYFGSSSGAISINTWYHVALTRESGVCRLFLDGSLLDSATISGSIDGTNLCVGGYYDTSFLYDGKMSNFRVIKGTALYTSNFTPPTRTLTAVPNTVLLTCQGNTIADASSSAHTITANGDISLTKEPFGGAGAVDFGGSADGLYTPNITLGSNDWTLEFWIYLTSTGTDRGLYSYFLNTTTARSISCYIDSSNQIVLRHRINDGTYPTATGSTALSAHTWYHVAAVRVNDDYYIYINGVQDASYTSAPAGHTYYADGVTHYIGYNRNATSDFDGLLSNVRLVNGTALYTSNFTPPAEPLTAVTNTELLTCQGQNIKDASSNAHTITPNGDVKATIVSSAFEFDGTDDYVEVARSDDFDFGTDPFTMECFAYFSSYTPEGSVIFGKTQSSVSAGQAAGMSLSSSGAIQFLASNNGGYNVNVTGGTLSLNRWYHLAWVRSGNSFYGFVNGVLSVTATDSNPISHDTTGSYGGIMVGGYSSAFGGDAGRYDLNGYISNLRILKGKGLTAAEVLQNYNALKGRYA